MANKMNTFVLKIASCIKESKFGNWLLKNYQILFGENDGCNLFESARSVSYCVILAAIPTLFFILNLMEFSPVQDQNLIEYAYSTMPSDTHPAMNAVFSILSNHEDTNKGWLWAINIIIVLFSCAGAIIGFYREFDGNGGNIPWKKYFKKLPQSIGVTFVLYTVLVVSSIVLMFATNILENVAAKFNILDFFNKIREGTIYSRIIASVIFSIAVWILYRSYYSYSNFGNGNEHRIMPGVLLSGMAFFGISFIFDLWNHLSDNKLYASLSGVITILLWVYWVCIAIIVGHNLNVYPERRQKKERDKIMAEERCRKTTEEERKSIILQLAKKYQSEDGKDNLNVAKKLYQEIPENEEAKLGLDEINGKLNYKGIKRLFSWFSN